MRALQSHHHIRVPPDLNGEQTLSLERLETLGRNGPPVSQRAEMEQRPQTSHLRLSVSDELARMQERRSGSFAVALILSTALGPGFGWWRENGVGKIRRRGRELQRFTERATNEMEHDEELRRK